MFFSQIFRADKPSGNERSKLQVPCRHLQVVGRLSGLLQHGVMGSNYIKMANWGLTQTPISNIELWDLTYVTGDGVHLYFLVERS